jgi:hypothetical protein
MSTVATYPAQTKHMGYQQLTVSTTAVALTVPAGATRAVCQVVAQPIRYRMDGTAPTSLIGYPAVATTVIEVNGMDNIKAFRAIRSGGTDATLEILYFQ